MVDLKLNSQKNIKKSQKIFCTIISEMAGKIDFELNVVPLEKSSKFKNLLKCDFDPGYFVLVHRTIFFLKPAKMS